jgi:hypothetical protein
VQLGLRQAGDERGVRRRHVGECARCLDDPERTPVSVTDIGPASG